MDRDIISRVHTIKLYIFRSSKYLRRFHWKQDQKLRMLYEKLDRLLWKWSEGIGNQILLPVDLRTNDPEYDLFRVGHMSLLRVFRLLRCFSMVKMIKMVKDVRKVK